MGLIMKGCVQWNPLTEKISSYGGWGGGGGGGGGGGCLNPGPLDQQASA